MRHVVLFGLGLLLMTVCATLYRILHLEWLRFDPVLVLSLYSGLYSRALPGVFLVFSLGVAADSLASTPPGMLANGYVLTWLIVRWSKQIFVFKNSQALLLLIGAMSLVFHLLVITHLVVMNIGAGPIWICLKSMLPNIIMNVLFALPCWGMAEKILPSEKTDKSSALLMR